MPVASYGLDLTWVANELHGRCDQKSGIAQVSPSLSLMISSVCDDAPLIFIRSFDPSALWKMNGLGMN